MGKASVKENKNIYQLAREELGLTRAQAAEKTQSFGLPEHRLVKIEDESVAIQPADVVALSRVYNKPDLRNFYCCNDCPIGQIDVPNVIYKDNIHEILVNMVVSLDSINRDKSRLMEILADGKIENDEERDFERIQEELERISMTVESLQLWCEKMKSSD